jgi:hypothetical protein
MPLTRRKYRKKRNLKVAQMILEGKTDKEIMETIRGLDPTELSGMKGFLRKPAGIKWAYQKGLIDEERANQLFRERGLEPPFKQPLEPKPLSKGPSEGNGETSDKGNVPLESHTANLLGGDSKPPASSQPSMNQPMNPPTPTPPIPPSPPPRVVATEEAAAVEVEGIPRKIRIGPKTLMFYQFFREGKIPGQQKPFEGDLGQFFDWVVNRYFTKFVGCDFVLRYEEEVAS